MRLFAILAACAALLLLPALVAGQAITAPADTWVRPLGPPVNTPATRTAGWGSSQAAGQPPCGPDGCPDGIRPPECGPGGCGPNGCPPQPGSPGFGSSPFAQAPPPSASRPPASQRPHPASCRIENRISQGMIFGSGTLIDTGNGFGLVVTCRHLYREGTGKVTCKFPNGRILQGKVVSDKDGHDISAILIKDPGIKPVDVATVSPGVGAAVFSSGYGSGSYAVNAGRVLRIDNNRLKISGVARDGDSGGPVLNSRGQLVGVLWGTDHQSYVECTSSIRTDAFLKRAGRYLLPWNAKVNDPARDPRLQPPQQQPSQQPQIIVQPPPPIAPLPPVDLGPLEARVDALEVIADKAIVLAAGWPELKAELAKVDAKATAAGEAATAADKKALGAAADANTAFSNSLDAEAAVAEAIDEENPKGPIGRLKARIEAAKAEGAEGAALVAKKVVFGALKSVAWPWGAIVGVFVGLVYWDIRKKVTGGDDLFVQKVAKRVRGRVGSVRQRLRNRFNPDDEEEEEEVEEEAVYVRRGSKFERVN